MKLSATSKKLIADCRLTAIRYKNDFISEAHFFLVYNRYRNENDLKVSIACQKASLKSILGINWGEVRSDGALPLTVHFDRVLKSSDFQRRIAGEKLVEPRHILLSVYMKNMACKQFYLDYLDRNKIKPGIIDMMLVRLNFNPLARKLRIIK